MRLFQGVIFLIMLGLMLLWVWIERGRARTGKTLDIGMRVFPALEALEEAVGRAVEMGKPILTGIGVGGFDYMNAPESLQGLEVFGHICNLCGKNGVPIRVFEQNQYMVPVEEGLAEMGYKTGGHPEMFHKSMITYAGNAADNAAIQYLWEERPASVIQFGALLTTLIRVYGQAGILGGIVMIAGTSFWIYQGVMVAVCDYQLIGEELFAAGTYLRKQPESLGVVRGQDLSKMVILGLFVFSLIASLAGYAIMSNLIKV